MSATFRPLPLFGSPHLQTIFGTLWEGAPFRRPTERRVVPLPDGDALQFLDSTPPTWQPGGPVALLVHGMGGSHRSGWVARLASLLWDDGWRTARLDLRGNRDTLGLARRFYHAGSSPDLRAAVALLGELAPGSPVALLGGSLGGNMALKLAGEAADDPLPNLAAVAAVSPPVDLEMCVNLLGQRRNRLYDRHFTRILVGLAHRRHELYPDTPKPEFPRGLTVRRFDEVYTAPRWGYADAIDYYRQNSAGPFVPRIRIPGLILTSRDDPFISPVPIEAMPLPPNVSLRIEERGGHLGFLGRDAAGGVRWLDHTLRAWLRQLFS